jgi:membrane-bound lytic murein transglycosylase D
LLVHRKWPLDNDVTEFIADNAQLALAPEITLKRIMVTARKGDTLASLAARHGVSAANLVTWNKLKPQANLSAGQSLAVLVPFQSARTGSKAVARKKGPLPAVQTARRVATQTAKR